MNAAEIKSKLVELYTKDYFYHHLLDDVDNFSEWIFLNKQKDFEYVILQSDCKITIHKDLFGNLYNYGN
jgi:hypothetical protein